VAPEPTVAPAAYTGRPGEAYQSAPAPNPKHSDRVLLIVLGVVLALLVLAGTFASGVAVGGRIALARRGLTANGPMMRGYGQGLGGQNQGQGYGGRRGMRGYGYGQGQGQGQLPQGHPQIPQGQTAPQGTTPTVPTQ
jgi:hypothetical protein